jgi:hypothetical protein
MASTHLARRRDSCVAEDVEISFSPHGDIGHLYIIPPYFTWNQTEGMVQNGQAGSRSLLQITQCCQISFS